VHLHRFKATEFRFFILYSGPIITYNILDSVKYDHFIQLHIAITIFSSAPLIKSYLYVAEESIRQFVCKASKIYGEDFVVYNIHSLLHLCTDVQIYGPLDRYSCFPFENYLQSLKRRIRSKRLPLEQVYNRIAEEEDIDTEIKSVTSNFVPKQIHYPNRDIVSHFTCEKLIYGNTKLSCKIPDNTVAIGNRIYVINQIVYIDGKYKCIGAPLFITYCNILFRPKVAALQYVSAISNLIRFSIILSWGKSFFVLYFPVDGYHLYKRFDII